MGKWCVLLVLMVIAVRTPAQLRESFNDGNFTEGPAWTGSAGSWQVVASSDAGVGAVNSNTLRLSAGAAGMAWLSVQVAGSWQLSQSWGFFIGRRSQSFTASNHSLIWLWCSEADLTAATADGYRIRIGDDSGGDEIVLQRVTDGVATAILTGPALVAGLTDIGFLLRVTRSMNGEWKLFTSVLPVANGAGAVATDVPDAGNAGVLHGSVTDNTYAVLDDGHLGFVSVHSGAVAARSGQEYDQVMVSFASVGLPVRLKRLTADADGGAVRLRWEVAEESGIAQYEVQRSGNGMEFTSIGAVPAEGRDVYSFVDDGAPLQGFYRLKIHDAGGSLSYSEVVQCRLGGTPFRAWPNPVRDVLTIAHPAGELQLLNAEGIVTRSVLVRDGVTKMDMAGLSPGLYHLVLQTRRQRTIIRIVKE